MPSLTFDIPRGSAAKKRGLRNYQGEYLRALEGFDTVHLHFERPQEFCFAYWAASRGLTLSLTFADNGQMGYYKGETCVHAPSEMLEKLLKGLTPHALRSKTWLPRTLSISTIHLDRIDNMDDLARLGPMSVRVEETLGVPQARSLFKRVHEADVSLTKEARRDVMFYNRTGILTQLTLREVSLKELQHFLALDVQLHRLCVYVHDATEAQKQALFDRADELGMVLKIEQW